MPSLERARDDACPPDCERSVPGSFGYFFPAVYYSRGEPSYVHFCEARSNGVESLNDGRVSFKRFGTGRRSVRAGTRHRGRRKKNIASHRDVRDSAIDNAELV